MDWFDIEIFADKEAVDSAQLADYISTSKNIEEAQLDLDNLNAADDSYDEDKKGEISLIEKTAENGR